MTPYDFEVMQDRRNFTTEIKNTLERLPSVLDFSDELNHFVLQVRQAEFLTELTEFLTEF